MVTVTAYKGKVVRIYKVDAAKMVKLTYSLSKAGYIVHAK